MDFDPASAEAYRKPFPVASDVEVILAKHIIRRSIVVGPLIVAIAFVAGGSTAALSACAGVAIVVVNFLIAGWLLSRAATVSMQSYHAAALFGFFIRLGFIAVSMFAVAGIFDVDRRAMGVSAIAAFIVLLVLESLAVMRGDRKDLEWS